MSDILDLWNLPSVRYAAAVFVACFLLVLIDLLRSTSKPRGRTSADELEVR